MLLSNLPDTLHKYIYHLVTFARLRNLNEFTEKQLEDMGIIFDMEQDAFFKKGEKRGEKRGIDKKAREVADTMLHLGKYTLEEIAQVSGLTLEEIKEMAEDTPWSSFIKKENPLFL